jgi:uncharacterized protein YkwD
MATNGRRRVGTAGVRLLALVVGGQLLLASCVLVGPADDEVPTATTTGAPEPTPTTEAPEPAPEREATQAPPSAAPSQEPSEEPAEETEAYADAVVAATNEARRAEGLDELQPSDCATDVAEARAQDLVGAGELSHAPLDPVLEECGPASRAAENLSRATSSPEAVVEAWLDSPGHRNNLLDPALTHLGVGCADDDGALLCAQIFLGS